MKLSDKQAQFLLSILYDSCRIVGEFGGISAENRLRLLNEIIDQQSPKPVELEKGNENENGR